VKKSLIVALTFLASVTASAQEGKDFVPPPVTPPAVFRGAEPSVDPKSFGDFKWFAIFKDPQLQDLIETALQQNTDLQTAMARIDVERAQLGITRSNQYPTFTAGAEETTTELSQHNPNFYPGFEKRSTSVGEVLTNLLSFELDIWGRLSSQTKAARAQLRATEEDRRTIMTMVVSDVASGYFNLLELDAEMAIDQQTLKTRNDSLDIIKARESGGLATMLDVRQGEELVQQAGLTITDTNRLIEQTENNIHLLLGELPGPVARSKSLADEGDAPVVPPGLTSELLLRRPDIRSAELNVEAQHFLIKSARAAYFPTITLTGFMGFQSSALYNLFTGGGFTGGVTPSLTTPIFNGGRLRSNVLLAEGNQRVALVNYEKVILQAFNDVSNALVQLARERELKVQEEQLVVTLKDRSSLAYLRYNGGVDTLLNALDADRDLFSSQLAAAQARRNELLALVQLYKALGGGWQQ
jgi:NodT family efflux transporter outer membrane factor (OMF) lipoprotein